MWYQLLKERICSLRSKFFTLRVDNFEGASLPRELESHKCCFALYEKQNGRRKKYEGRNYIHKNSFVGFHPGDLKSTYSQGLPKQNPFFSLLCLNYLTIVNFV